MKKRKSLYRFYNIKKGKYGEPFTMCDNCYKEYKPPKFVLMEKIADHSNMVCNICEK